MGDEIEKRYFSADDYSAFRQRLDAETDLLRRVFDEKSFSRRGNTVGFELEAWLVDAACDPFPCNERFLERLDNPLVVPELAAFNVELNGSPTSLSGRVFSRLHDELSSTWSACCETAEEMGAALVTIGTLPTVRESMLCAEHMSSLTRYRSLNDQVVALRDGRPLSVDIDGESPLHTTHGDVMLEAAATSFQIHLQCHPEHAVRDFNASLAVSAPMVAVSANSPFLFGHALWDETRIPLFEQAVDVGQGQRPRVTFGEGYARESLYEIFEQNRADYRLLMPAVHDAEPREFRHVRFHNGTLWRWNRPLIGFDSDGQIHLRIEHRVVPAGPTLRDCIANSAFYFGLIHGLALDAPPIASSLPFEIARDNFYRCARHGLDADVIWPGTSGTRRVPVRALVVETLLPTARRGLRSVHVPDAEIDDYLDIIGARTDSGLNGATWQRRWIARNGPEPNALVEEYRALQQRNLPVHEWPL